jgi:hypothetical protein
MKLLKKSPAGQHNKPANLPVALYEMALLTI